MAAQLAVPSEVTTPADLGATTAGADAVSFDTAAVGWASGWEMQLRHRLVRGEESDGRTGAYAVVPVGRVALSAGYEWLRIPGRWHQRGMLGVAVRVSPRLSLGAGYRRLVSHRNELDGVRSVDVGLAARPWSWLSLSLGLDDLNRPRIAGARQQRSLRVGAGVRPWLAQPWLTIGAETRVTRDPWDATGSRLLLDVGLNGLHAMVAYAPQGEELWVGVSVAAFGAEARGLGALPGGAPDHVSGSVDLGLALTLRERPAESILELDGRTVELAASGELEVVRRSAFDEPPVIPALALQLAELAEDPTVGTVILNVGKLDVGLATIAELRRGIHALRRRGKRVVAELSNADDKTYLVAAAADRICMDPSATLRVDGFAVSVNYFAAALQTIGVRFESVEVGRYKSGPDPLTRSAPRQEDLETQQQILEQAYLHLVAAVASDRGLLPDHVQRLIDRGAFTATEALQEGLVDELSQPSDLHETPTARPRGESFDSTEKPSRIWGQPSRIAVVPVRGTIVMRSRDNILPGDSAAAPAIVSQLEAARRDRDVVGVVLRVNSGGGDVYASELIWRAVRRVAEVKPVVASCGDTAASGGYYVAVAADAILAEADTITGSIGIFSVKPDLSRLYKLVGITPHVYKKGAHADWKLTTRGLSEEERRTMLHLLEGYYDGFVQRVALGRKLELGRARELAEGRVYTGEQAMMFGLVDGLGGLADAIAEVRSRAGVDPAEEVEVDIPVRTWSLEDLASVASSRQGSIIETWEELQRRLQALDGRGLALTPVTFEVDP